jgi:hypothetical protein
MILGLINLGLKLITGLINFAQQNQLIKAGEAKIYAQLAKDMQDATQKAIKIRNSTDDTDDNDELLFKSDTKSK